jgi:predicted O-methyltransferase YrrM
MSHGSIGLDDRLNHYLVANHPPEHPVLAELRKVTARMANSVMQVPPEEGHLLAFLVRLIGAKNALEIGTFTGYSALAVALALPRDGHLVACDINEAWTSIGRRHWEKAGVADKVELRLGPALATLKLLKKEGWANGFDFAFIDAAKSEYDEYYEQVLKLVRKGGIIAFDNMLWYGSVAKPGVKDGETKALRALNAKIAGDNRVDPVLLPVGDGMMLARRVR